MENCCILYKGIYKMKPYMCQKVSFMQIKLSLILDLSICIYCYPLLYGKVGFAEYFVLTLALLYRGRSGLHP